MLDLDTIDSIIENIVTNIKTTAFFVGAGISKNSGLPDFYEFNKQILQLTTGSNDEQIIQKLRPEVILQAMKDELGDQSMSCLEIFRNDLLEPNLNHKILANILTNCGMVITTNWDNLIEMECFQNGIKYQVIHTEEQYEKIMRENLIGVHSDYVQIFKIHGDIEKHNSNFDFSSIQITLNDVGGGLSKWKKIFLDYVHANRTMCFVGYSAMDDFDILPSIRINHTDKGIFWIKHSNTNNDDILLKEQIKEQNRSLDTHDKNYYRIKNVNDILLTSNSPKKILINTCEFMKHFFVNSEECSNKETKNLNNSVVFDNFESFTNNLEKSKKSFLLANLLEKTGMYETAIFILKNILHQSEKNNEDFSQAYYRLARIFNKFYGKKVSLKILQYYDKAIDYTTSDNKKAEFLISKANYLRREEKKYYDAERCMNQAEHLISDDLIRVIFLNIKGLLYLGKKKPEIAEKYFQESYQSRGGNVPGLAESSNALGLALMYQEKLEQSRKWFDIALDLNLRTANYRGAGQQCLNLLRWHSKSIEKTKDMQEIEHLFSEGNKIYKDVKQYWSYLDRILPPETELLECELRKCELDYEYVFSINDKSTRIHHARNVTDSIENILKQYKRLEHETKIEQCENLKSKFQKLVQIY